MEHNVLRAIQACLRKRPMCYCFEHGGMDSKTGFPDRFDCGDGRFAAFADMCGRGRLGMQHKQQIRRLQAAGNVADVVNCLEEVRGILRHIQCENGENGESYDHRENG